MIRFNMPKLRIYQQILICFGLIVSVPLLGVTFIINNINQQAMKKELARFTEHTAEALYRDFSTEMSWQKQQSRMMARLLGEQLSGGKTFEVASRQVMDLDNNLDAIGFYNSQGQLIKTYYRDFDNLSPELRLPDSLSQERHDRSPKITFQPFQVIYFNSGNPQDSPYYLRAVIPVDSVRGAAYTTENVKEKIPTASPTTESTASTPAFYVQQKNFSYLRNLVRSNNSLYDAFYIIDSDGIIIAGPLGADRQERISPQDFAQFEHIKPGVTHEFSSSAQATYDEENNPNPQTPTRLNKKATVAHTDPEEPPTLKKVIVKMPEINWGIIIESPYHVKQKYIKRAGVNTFLLALACLAIMLLLVLPYILGISRNFRQLIKGVKAMGEGNYYRRIRLITNFFTPYEIVYLTLEFNRMARKTADSWQTIQEANRKLAQMDEFKSNLIDTVSHELRTPLTSIKGYTSRLLRYDNALDAETRIKSLKVVKQQADRLSRMVEDLLVIPDLETSRLRVYPDQVALLPLLENAIQFIQLRYANEAERELLLSVSPELPEELSVLADPDRLEQIVLNLLDNAVKYSSPDSPIAVFVTTAESASNATESEPQILIRIVNQCDPIPMASQSELDSLFEKFKRLDDSLVRTTRGSGLGLYITRELVSAMGGRIELHYEDGQFTTCFTVPVYNGILETPDAAAIPI